MKCEICGCGHVFAGCFNVIADRVAKLEAERDLAAAGTASSADKADVMNVGSGQNVATSAAAGTEPPPPETARSASAETARSGGGAGGLMPAVDSVFVEDHDSIRPDRKSFRLVRASAREARRKHKTTARPDYLAIVYSAEDARLIANIMNAAQVPQPAAPPTAPAIPDGFALAPGVPWWSVGGDTPWPLRAILERLAKSTSHLLNAHGCDCDQWETTAAARDAALSLLALVPAEPSGTRGEARACTCADPPPGGCQRKYAQSECDKAAAPAIPDGFALAPGWEVACDCHPRRCAHPWNRDEDKLEAVDFDCDARGAFSTEDGGLSCAAHAVEMGALVPAEPSGKSGELRHCSHDGCDRNGVRCGSDDRWWCDPHWNGAAPAPQPEAPAGCVKCGAAEPTYADASGRLYCRPCARGAPLPAEPPRCGAGRSDCFCAARDENAGKWCAKCANAWCCADEDDPSADCRVDPPAERPAPEAVRGCRGCRLGYPLDGELHKPIGSDMCPYEWMRCTDTDPSETAKAPLSRVIEALRTVEGPDYAEGFAAGVAESNAKVADLEARVAQAGLFLAVKDKVLAGFEKRAEEQDAKLAAAEKCKECGGTNGVDPFCDDCYSRDIDARVAEERGRCLAWLMHREAEERIASGTPAPTVKP